MKKGIMVLQAVLLLCILSGCVAKPEDIPASVVREPDPAVVSPARTPGELPAPSVTPTPSTAQTPEALPTSAPTPSASSAPEITETKTPEIGKYHPVIAGGFLLGGSDGDRWLNPNGLIYSWEYPEPSEIEKSIQGNEIYKIYNLEGYIGDGIGGKVIPHDEDWKGSYTEHVDIKHSVKNENFVAVNCDWDCMPRKPVALSPDSEIYTNIVKGVLSENGLDDVPIEILQIYRVDLDGDAIDEVILYAEHSDSNWRFGVLEGTYSLLLLRKVVDGEVENIILDIDINKQAITDDFYKRRYIFAVNGILDLNGDGKLELITSGQEYEGIWYYVYEIAEDGANLVMGNGWGA